jgi:hypothetical protein
LHKLILDLPQRWAAQTPGAADTARSGHIPVDRTERSRLENTA